MIVYSELGAAHFAKGVVGKSYFSSTEEEMAKVIFDNVMYKKSASRKCQSIKETGIVDVDTPLWHIVFAVYNPDDEQDSILSITGRIVYRGKTTGYLSVNCAKTQKAVKIATGHIFNYFHQLLEESFFGTDIYFF